MQDIFPSKILKTRFLILKIKLKTKQHSAAFCTRLNLRLLDCKQIAARAHNATVHNEVLQCSEAGNTAAAAHL